MDAMDKEFGDAFMEGETVVPGQSEDESFGITPTVESDAPPAADAPAADPAPVEPAADLAAEPVVDVAPAADGTQPAEGDAPADEAPVAEFDPAKERQRLKSWEGRLRKIEADLAAKADKVAAGTPESNGPVDDGSNAESATAEALEQVANSAEDDEPALATAADDMAEKVESGEMTPEQAMRQLAEDFGEPFVKMIEVIAAAAAGKTADSKFGQVRSDIDEVISHISNARERAHFEAIAEAHPDFDEIGQSEAFKAFAGTDPERQRIAASGSAKEINKLLTEFKAQSSTPETPADAQAPATAAAPAASPEDEEAMDAAEGVRSSGGLSLPKEPTPAGDYEAAWNDS